MAHRNTLVLTVGGKPGPVQKSILHDRPNRVIFVCSEDDPVSGKRGSYTEVAGIVSAVGLNENDYRVELVPSDNPGAIIRRLRELLRRELDAAEGEVVADYTAGTKSMSGGLLVAASSIPEVRIRLVAGPRVDLVSVRDGFEQVQELPDVHAEWARVKAEDAWRSFRYRDAVRALESSARDPVLRRILIVSRGFALWDELSYADAAAHLRELGRFVPRWIPTLAVLERFAKGERHNPARDEALVVTDLLHMADRREAQGLPDMAVLLRYRALEWIAQWSLRHHHAIDVSDVAEDAPESVRRLAHPDHGGKLVLGMEAAWQALAALGGPMAELARATEGERRDVSSRRNASVLAHGRSPLTAEDGRRIRALVVETIAPAFWKVACGNERCPSPQLPQEFSEIAGS